MVNEHVGYKGNGERRGEKATLNKAEIHDKEEKCKIQAYTRITILRMTGKKIFHNTDQTSKLEE